ncbi:Peptide deformylase EC 35188 CDS [Bradyrhizobium sp.]|uniref:peptide deformylase n=1 Tax=Bradyrhizobium sp. TaxID=376 RepID=UPI0007C1A3FD|nr:peptide deformylase [Bradyrhizobium sp.]CUU19210.1 Peptide deformylase EC 35188 CDS [Bradyrhizobium sp.]
MTIRPLLRYPDRRLATPAHPVTAFDGALRELAADLLDTMRAAPGIGITAPHIGVPLRVVVLELDAKAGPQTYVEVQRHARVRISYWDLDGNMHSEESDGLRAVCHQHEIDQLDGMFWIQRLSRLKRERLVKKFEKMSRD